MVQLLIYEEQPPANEQAATRFGGLPLNQTEAVSGWPQCSSCEEAMQFLGQLRVTSEAPAGDYLLLLFMCQNDPGMCEEWDASAGGNKVIIVPVTDDMTVMVAPDNETVLRTIVHGSRVQQFTSETYDGAREDWKRSQGESRHVLGQLFGKPSWIQADETPQCDSCAQPMKFIAQLEEGPEYQTAMNFGGGSAYVFVCHCGPGSGKMLWQQ